MVRKNFLIFLSISIILIFLIVNLFYSLVSQNFSTILVIVVYILTSYSLLKLRCGLTFVYLSYLILAHAGIPIIDLLLEDPLRDLDVNTNWYFTSYREKAVLISYIFITSICFFAMLINLFKKRTLSNKTDINFKGDNKWIFTGELLIIIFFIYLVYLFTTGKLPLFGTYQNYFSALSNLNFYQRGIFLYAVGITMILSNIFNMKNNKKSIFIIFLPGILLLLTGNRGEIFYPLLAGMGVLITRGLKINYKLILVVVIVFFIVIPSVKEIRNMDSNQTLEEVNLSIIDPFVQIGYTLRPHVYTVGWIENGEEFIFGESFLVPVQRGLSNFIPFMPPIEYEGKPYSFRDRLPTMGYSIVAETYYNFGIIGSFIISPLLVFFLTYLGDRPKNFLILTLITGITTVLINNIRNAFAFVPGQIIIIIGLLGMIVLLNLLLSKNKKVYIK
ncbi:O-antigen polysaccharide polymerase Wzy [Peribacillus sp. TH27]|uniref:O-antigen polysaccharide polymerase Wzy n=1 Tax=Peribacillus sp. TH27 TaxID=2798484 RepID=UPI0019133011|nr:O-antigen polysaccharide polymerase Wzy [Peribacillus sp. TH27]MBK5462546.1 O-antigen polysaccharide polymerase Wzy [Peribacillus sp. TH27]